MDNDVEKRFEAFVTLVRRMRMTQKAYFKRRDATVLRESKDLERRCDAALIELAGGKAPTLFSGPDGAA